MKLKDVGEFGLIERIKQIVARPNRNIIIGIDDDAAAFAPTPGWLTLATADTLTETIHFDPGYFTFQQLGWRALAANLSDIAAMGGHPKFALFCMALPERLEAEAVLQIYEGAQELADRFDVAIVGGDTTQSPQHLMLSLTVLGEVEPDKIIRRSGAKPGDAIFVTGDGGGAHAGLRALQNKVFHEDNEAQTAIAKHLQPMPRVDAARALVANFKINAMIDVSDGVASEVHHICQQSNTGARIFAADLPLSAATRHVADSLKESAVDYALYGGEDFELLFTAPAGLETEIHDCLVSETELACHRIGEITASSGEVTLIDPAGKSVPLAAKGFRHFQSEAANLHR